MASWACHFFSCVYTYPLSKEPAPIRASLRASSIADDAHEDGDDGDDGCRWFSWSLYCVNRIDIDNRVEDRKYSLVVVHVHEQGISVIANYKPFFSCLWAGVMMDDDGRHRTWNLRHGIWNLTGILLQPWEGRYMEFRLNYVSRKALNAHGSILYIRWYVIMLDPEQQQSFLTSLLEDCSSTSCKDFENISSELNNN